MRPYARLARLDRAITPADRAELSAAADGTDLSDLVVVFVIGETARHDRFGLLGHDRPTTPRLAATPHVAGFAGRSCDTATKLSLAREFHAIGDTEGARSLVKEVIAEADGAVKARAERFLAELT